MAWIIKYDASVVKELKKLDKSIVKRILDYIEQISYTENPRSLGKALQGNLRQYWRYRMGDYRIICNVQDNILQILVVRIAHRKNVYK